MDVRDRGALFRPIEGMSREHRFPDTTWTSDLGIVLGKSGDRRLKRTKELIYFLFAVN